MNFPFSKIENLLNYKFNNNHLLLQAFTRRSFSHENPEYPHNEILEFIGDAIIQSSLTAIITDKFQISTGTYKYSEGTFSKMRSHFTLGSSQADVIDRLGLSKFILCSNGDKLNHVPDVPSVQEDLFEAIIGAIALDSNYNLECINKILTSLFDLNAFFSELSDQPTISDTNEHTSRALQIINLYGPITNDTRAVNILHELHQKGIVKYLSYDLMDLNTSWECICSVDEIIVGPVYSSRRNLAKNTAAYLALTKLTEGV